MDDSKLKDDVIDGEEITEDEVASNAADFALSTAGIASNATGAGPEVGAAETLLNLEELIKNHIESTDKLKDEIKQAREMFEDSFNNNPTYNDASVKLKDVAKGRNSIRQQIAKQPSVAVVAQKVKDLRFDLSEQTKTLSDLLQDYHEQTGATQIEARNGQVLEIVSTAKLVRKSKFNP